MVDTKYYTLTLEDNVNEIFFSTAIDGPQADEVMSAVANAMRAMGFAEGTIRGSMREYIAFSEDD